MEASRYRTLLDQQQHDLLQGAANIDAYFQGQGVSPKTRTCLSRPMRSPSPPSHSNTLLLHPPARDIKKSHPLVVSPLLEAMHVATGMAKRRGAGLPFTSEEREALRALVSLIEPGLLLAEGGGVRAVARGTSPPLSEATRQPPPPVTHNGYEDSEPKENHTNSIGVVSAIAKEDTTTAIQPDVIDSSSSCPPPTNDDDLSSIPWTPHPRKLARMSPSEISQV